MGWNPFSSTAAPPPPPSELPQPTELPSTRPAPEISVKNAVSSSIAPSNTTTRSAVEDAKPQSSLATQAKNVDEQYREFKAMLGLGLVGLCPLLMILPPRRFNAITFLQGGMFTWGVNEQTAYRTGHDLIWHYNRWVTDATKK